MIYFKEELIVLKTCLLKKKHIFEKHLRLKFPPNQQHTLKTKEKLHPHKNMYLFLGKFFPLQ